MSANFWHRHYTPRMRNICWQRFLESICIEISKYIFYLCDVQFSRYAQQQVLLKCISSTVGDISITYFYFMFQAFASADVHHWSHTPSKRLWILIRSAITPQVINDLLGHIKPSWSLLKKVCKILKSELWHQFRYFHCEKVLQNFQVWVLASSSIRSWLARSSPGRHRWWFCWKSMRKVCQPSTKTLAA